MKISEKALSLLSLEGKVAVITGAASGIGRGTAELFAQMGSKVALLDIDQTKGVQVESCINKDGGCAKFFKCDVTSDADCRKATEDIIASFGKIDILFNNAGVSIRKNTVDLSEKEWDLTLDVTLKGIFMISQQHLQGTGEDMLGHMVPTEDKENVRKMHISSPNTRGVGFKKGCFRKSLNVSID